MKQQGILLFTLVLVATLLLSSCQSELKEFSLSYSFESVDNYKVMITIDSDKKYKIEKFNYFMDNHENTQRPFVIEGSLTDEEYITIKTAIQDSRIFKMEDSYGFVTNADNGMGNIIYQLTLDADGKQKFVTFRDNTDVLIPDSLLKLTQHLNTFIKTYEQNKPEK